MINKLFKNKTFLAAAQFFTLLIFILLVTGAMGVSTDDAAFAKILRNTNLSNLIVWSYWWPLIIVTAILFGRYWCSICPMELITSFFGKIGLRRKPPKWLKSGWVITFFYALILILGIHTFSIHRIPTYMAAYLLILLVVAVLVGFIWEKRSFCTYVCPIGHLLGLYSMLSFSKLRVKNHEVCKNCTTKDCISKKNHYKFTGRSCTSELYPATLSDNRHCILCGQCFKSCTHDNISIQKRGIAEDLFKNIRLSMAEMFFFFMVSGFVIYEILSEWKPTKDILLALPHSVNQNLGIEGPLAGTVKALILFVLFPLAFYLLWALLKKLFTGESVRAGLNQLVLAILPLTASMHLFKAMLKTSSRIPYWKYVWSDPEGVETARRIMTDPSMLHNSFLSSVLSPGIKAFALVLLIGGFILSIRVIKKQEHANIQSRIITGLASTIYFALFLVSLIAWEFGS